MTGRNEGCASIGCLGICFLFVAALVAGSGSGGDSGGTYPPAYPPSTSAPAPSPPAPQLEPREWLYIHGPMNVRAAPDKNASIVRTLSRGDRAQLGPREANGWARIYTGAAEDEYVYRASDLVRADPPAAAVPSDSRQLHIGPRGGCYYISDSGRKQYVDRSACSSSSASVAPEPLITTGSGSSGGARRSSGRQLHIGPRGGCYYINSNGNKTYVDRSECY